MDTKAKLCLTTLGSCQSPRRGKRLLSVCQEDERRHSREWSHEERDKEDFPESQ